jgi:hypothetical protein
LCRPLTLLPLALLAHESDALLPLAHGRLFLGGRRRLAGGQLGVDLLAVEPRSLLAQALIRFLPGGLLDLECCEPPRVGPPHHEE